MALLAILAVVSGVAALSLAYRQSAPGIVSRLASRYLDRHVEVEAFEIEMGQALEVQLRGVRVYPGDDASGEPLLEIPHAIGTQSWPRLLVGQLIPGKWQVAAPVLRGDLGGGPGEQDRTLALPLLPPLDLSVREGTVILRRGTEPPLRITDIELTTTRARLRARVTGAAQANLWVGDVPLGAVEASLHGWRENVSLETHVNDLDLSIAPLPLDLPLRGLASGDVTLHTQSGRVSGAVDLDVTGFEVELPGMMKPLAPASTRVALEFEQDPRGWTLRPQPLALDDLVVTGALRVGTGRGARLSGQIDLKEFRPGVPSLGRLHFVSLMGLRFQTWQNMDQRIEAGVVDSFHLELDLALEGIGDAFAFRRKLTPDELSGRATIHSGVYRTGPTSAPLEGIRGMVVLSGNTLSVQQVRMSRSGKPLPELDITIDGMHRFVYLPLDERQRPAGPGVPLPGLGPGVRALAGPDNERPPPEIHFSDAQIGYPAFLLPIRNARGTMRFPGNRLWIERAEAVVGGVPGLLSVLWDPQANTVAAQIEYGDGEAPAQKDPGPHWVSARIAVDPLYLGDWRLDQIHGWLYGEGSTIEFRDLSGRYSSGPASGSGTVSLANPEGAEYSFLASVHHAEASGLCEPMLRPEGSITGKLSLDGRFAGRLDPDRPALETADYGMALLIEDGTLDELPATMVLARLPSLQGIRGLFGARLPFSAMSADVALRDGILRTENLALQSSELRMHTRGTIDLLSEDRDSDMVMAFLFLQTVDRMIGTLPVVGNWVLGDDQSLVSLYFHLDGPWDDPRVRPVTPEAVQAAGWAVNLVADSANQLFRFFFTRSQQPPEEPAENGSPPDDRPQQAP